MPDTALPVTQEDRKAAAALFARTSDEAARQALAGNWDMCTEIQTFARHRLTADAAGKREGLERAERIATDFDSGRGNEKQIAAAIRERIKP